MARNSCTRIIYKGTFISNQSLDAFIPTGTACRIKKLMNVYTYLLCVHQKFKPYANLMIMSGNNHTLKINLTTKYGERKNDLQQIIIMCVLCATPHHQRRSR